MVISLFMRAKVQRFAQYDSFVGVYFF